MNGATSIRTQLDYSTMWRLERCCLLEVFPDLCRNVLLNRACEQNSLIACPREKWGLRSDRRHFAHRIRFKICPLVPTCRYRPRRRNHVRINSSSCQLKTQPLERVVAVFSRELGKCETQILGGLFWIGSRPSARSSRRSRPFVFWRIVTHRHRAASMKFG